MKTYFSELFFYFKLFVNSNINGLQKLPAITLILFSMLGLSEKSQAQTRQTVLYVDANYTGTTPPDGTEVYPYKTIRDALDYRGNVQGLTGMVSNEEIVVKAGTYTPDSLKMNFITGANGGKDNHWLTLRAEGDVFLDGANLYTKKFASLIAVTSGAENVRIKGFKLKNQRNNQSLAEVIDGVLVKDTKFGIQVANTAKNIEITDNEIYDFSWTLDVDPMKNRIDFTASEITILKAAEGGDNCGAINVTGTDLVPITNVVIKNNYIHNVIPGWTEGIQINGNVDGFEVSNNTIAEVQNIGIVAAGHYDWVIEIQGATVTPALNYARNGIIKNNKVSSCRSPIAAAAGIYCDGSQNIIVENNTSSDGQVGFSIGNENSNVNSGGHTLRNNLSYDNVWAGIILGVPGAASGSYIDDVKVTGNTVFRNGGVTDTYLGNMGASECIVNKNIKNLSVKNNIFYAVNHNTLVSFSIPFDTAMTSYISSISFDYNLYFTNSTDTTPLGVFDWSQLGTGYDYYGTFDWYRINRTDQDVNSSFANPNFVNMISSPIDLNLQAASPAINAGDPNYVTTTGETDFYGNNRINQSIVDIGAYEALAVIDGYNSIVENYEPLITGVTNSSFSNIYGYVDSEYIYLYAEIAAANLSEYRVFINTNSATGFQHLWTDKSDYFIDANDNILNEYSSTGSPAWSFIQASSSTGVEFIKTATTVEGKILKTLLGIGNSGTIGIGLEGHTANWTSSLGGVPTSGNMVYLSLAGSSSKSAGKKSALEIEIFEELSDFKLGVYPNPALDKLTINYLTKEDGPVSIELIGLDGRKYFFKEMYLKAGNHTQSIAVKKFNRGISILRIKTPKKIETAKIILK